MLKQFVTAFLTFALGTAVFVGCSENSDDTILSPPGEDSPSSDAQWSRINASWMRGEIVEDTCPDLMMRVFRNGEFAVVGCNRSREGNLSSDEYDRLKTATNAVLETASRSVECDGAVIADLEFDHRIVGLNGEEFQVYFTLDTLGTCHRGDLAAIQNWDTIASELALKYESRTTPTPGVSPIREAARESVSRPVSTGFFKRLGSP